jgi:hypothetical protein
MKLNIGKTDRMLRVVAGFGLLGFAMFGPDVPYKLAGLLGLPLLITALVRFCPAYPLFGLSTRGKGDEAGESSS